MKIPDLYRKKKHELLTSAEVCRLLRISRDTLYRMIKRGALPTIKVGATYRFRAAEVITYYETIPRSYPLYFRPEVMERYQKQPDRYRVRPIKGGGGWIELIELHQQAMGTGTYEGLIHYHERQWPNEEKVILLTQPQFLRLPMEEKMHFRRFEID